MSNKTKAVFIVIAGLVLVAVGVLASIYLIQRMEANRPAAETEGQTVKTTVVVVTRDLSLGDTVAGGDVKLVSVPVEFAPRDAISTLEAAVGKIVKTDLVQGEMLLGHNLADPTNNNGDLSFVLSENHVLMAFPAADLISVNNVIQRGDIVDIFATFQQKVKTVTDNTVDPQTGEPVEPEMRTFTVDTFQKVNITAMVLEVISTEEQAPIQEGGATTTKVNTRIKAYLLALDPQDALVLKHLKDTNANFDLVLRAPTSTVQFDLTPVTEDYIIEYYGLEILP